MAASSAALILVAAGKGARMGAPVPKPFLPLAGRPMLTHSLQTLCQLEHLERAIVVVAADRRRLAKVIIDKYGPWPVPIELVEGGAERQDSVAAGLARVETELLLVHDAARPFIAREHAEQALQAAEHDGAAIVAVPAHDTLKWSEDRATIARTVDRDQVWLAQTPQAFRTELLRRGLAQAKADGKVLTDCAATIEALGLPVRLIQGDPNNRKITTAADLEWAVWYASRI